MSIQANFYSFTDLQTKRGFDQNALRYAANATCPFYSFATFSSNADLFDIISCQLFKLKDDQLESTIVDEENPKIPCFTISTERIAQLAKTTFFSHPSDEKDRIEFNLKEALIFAGPYQYFFKDDIPDFEKHLSKDEVHRQLACNVCNFQLHAMTCIPDIYRELDPENTTAHQKLTELVEACRKQKCFESTT